MPHSESPQYIGRFAPSPTGYLHFGSLLAALASYLDARSQGGRWLVRIEDLDPPREVPGATDQILRTLERFELHWDGKVMYQSHRQLHYQDLINHLLAEEKAYFCHCSRQQITRRGPVYDGYCRQRQAQLSDEVAVRLKTANQRIGFDDAIQGHQNQRLETEVGDFVIRRKDQLYAYQLAVVADDAEQGVTHIVRGCDLLDSTPRQIYLYSQLDYPPPDYAHIPIMVNAQGQKLSKQTFATALDPDHPERSLFKALSILGHQPPAELSGAPATELLGWGASHWSLTQIPRRREVPEAMLQG